MNTVVPECELDLRGESILPVSLVDTHVVFLARAHFQNTPNIR